MELKVGSYVVFEVPLKPKDPPEKKAKRIFAKVQQLTPKKAVVAAVKNGKKFEGPIENVLALLGRKPAPGRVYGQKTEYPSNVCMMHGQQVTFYTDEPDDSDLADLDEALKEVAKLMTRLKIPIEFAVRPKSGNKVYSFRTKSVKKEKVGVISLYYPNAFGDSGDILSHIVHELGVGYWFLKLERKHKVRWIKAYHDAVVLSDVAVGKVEKMAQAFMKSGETTTEFLKTLASKDNPSEEEIDLFKRLVSWIKQVHCLSKKNLDALSLEGKVTKDLFPDQKVVLGWVKLSLAKMDPSELFVDTFYKTYFEDEIDPNMKKLYKVAGGV